MARTVKKAKAEKVSAPEVLTGVEGKVAPVKVGRLVEVRLKVPQYHHSVSRVIDLDELDGGERAGLIGDMAKELASQF